MRQLIAECVRNAIEQAIQRGTLSLPEGQGLPEIIIENPKEKSFGDFACTIAMPLAKIMGQPPRAIAQAIMAHLSHSAIEKVEIAGPGFMNFFVRPAASLEVLRTILREGEQYGRSAVGQNRRVMVEFVSANPTGPLHIGHGRGAAVGDAIARILEYAGYNVHREYYINDAGNQMNNLGLSTYIRYMQLLGHEEMALEESCYQGDYITDIARDVLTKYGRKFEGDRSSIPFFTTLTGDVILQGIKDDLQRFRVSFDHYFSEKDLHEQGHVSRELDQLQTAGKAYEEGDALWVRTTAFGDDKDRVVRRGNGETTYFAADIAYHRNKFQRGFDTLIDIWGADHHGYVNRLKAAVNLLDRNPDDLEVILIQLVSLQRAGVPVAMSTRSGEFDALHDVLDEVGTDAARYFFLMRRCDSHLDFDLELAKQQTNDNPVFYVQYCHARCCSIIEQLKANDKYPQQNLDAIDFSVMDTEQEKDLAKVLGRFTEVVEGAALAREPHRIPHYLNEVASAFHSFYNVCRVMNAPTQELLAARTIMVEATRQVVCNGLHVIGIDAPQRM